MGMIILNKTPIFARPLVVKNMFGLLLAHTKIWKCIKWGHRSTNVDASLNRFLYVFHAIFQALPCSAKWNEKCNLRKLLI